MWRISQLVYPGDRNVGARREGRRAGRRACNRRRVDGPQRARDLLRG